MRARVSKPPVVKKPVKATYKKATSIQQQTQKLAASRKRRALTKRILNIALVIGVILCATFVVWLTYYDGSKKISEALYIKVNQASSNMGLNLEQVYLEGTRYLSTKEVIDYLDIKPNAPEGKVSIVGISPYEIREKLAKLGWVKNAYVSREFPNHLKIRIIEREPAALWQFKGKLHLIDGDGVVITDKNLHSFSDFPLIVGKDANQHANALFTTLATVPELMPYFSAATWIGNRRWDIKLKNDIIVKMPEKKTEIAWQKLKRLKEEQRLFERDIKYIDLRIEGRYYIEPRVKPPQ